MFLLKYTKLFFIIFLLLFSLFLFFYENTFPFKNLIVWCILIFVVCLKVPVCKIYKDNSKIEFIFLLIFFIGLLIPTIQINESNISKEENRRLTKWTPIINKQRKLNYNFGSDYEKWLKDRFYGRIELIKLYDNLNYKIAIYVHKSGRDFVIKKTNYFLGKANNIFSIKKEEMHEIGKNLKTFRMYLDKKGIKLYVVVVPGRSYFYKDKNIIYKNVNTDELSNLNLNRKKNKNNKAQQLEKILNKKYHIKYISMEKVLREKQNEDFIFYKTDHHMTDYGYFITYKTLMDQIKKDFTDINISKMDDFILSKNKLVRHNDERTYHLGIQQKKSNLRNEDILDVYYTFFDYKDLDNIKVEYTEDSYQKHINPNGKYKVMLIGDSFTKGLVYFLNTSFSEIELYRVNNKKYPFDMQPFYSKIDEFKPDIIIFVRTSNGIKNLKYIYPQNKKKTRSGQ